MINSLSRIFYFRKCVQIRCFFWSECRKMRTRKNSVFGYFSRGDKIVDFEIICQKNTSRFQKLPHKLHWEAHNVLRTPVPSAFISIVLLRNVENLARTLKWSSLQYFVSSLIRFMSVLSLFLVLFTFITNFKCTF